MGFFPIPKNKEDLARQMGIEPTPFWTGKHDAPKVTVPLPPAKEGTKEALFGEKPLIASKILVAKKVVNKGFLFGQVGYGGGEIDLGQGYGLQIVASGNDWRVLQLFKYAIDAEVQTKGWTKPVVKYEKKPEPVKKEERKIVAKVESEDAW